MSKTDILQENQGRDLYFLDNGRIIYMPKGWANEMRQDDEMDICIICWYGNPYCLAYQNSGEWLTTDAQALFNLSYLENLPEVSEEEARRIDGDLFVGCYQ